jgi:hypothetical protein
MSGKSKKLAHFQPDNHIIKQGAELREIRENYDYLRIKVVRVHICCVIIYVGIYGNGKVHLLLIPDLDRIIFFF